jgi:hypothetical protein
VVMVVVVVVVAVVCVREVVVGGWVGGWAEASSLGWCGTGTPACWLGKSAGGSCRGGGVW